MKTNYSTSDEVREEANTNDLLYAIYRAGQIIKSDKEADLLTDAIKNYILGEQ